MQEVSSKGSQLTCSDHSDPWSVIASEQPDSRWILNAPSNYESQPLNPDSSVDSGAELLFPGMTDPVATDDAAFEGLFARHPIFGTYRNRQVELSFVGYLWGWQFASLLVTTTVVATWVLLSGIMLSVNQGEDGSVAQWIAFGAMLPLILFVVYLRRDIVVQLPKNANGRGNVEQRAALLQKVERAALAGHCFATLVFLAVSLVAEVECRNLAGSSAERNFCRYHGYVVVVSMPLLPFAFLRLPAISIAPHTVITCFLFIIVRSVTIAYVAAIPPTPLKLAIYGVSLAVYLVFISLAIMWQDRQRRDDFERSARRRRLANEVARHEIRIRRILNTVLPDDTLVKLMKGEPVVNRSPKCTVIATRIFDYPLWSASYLPPVAVNIVDAIFSSFDNTASKFACERVVQTDEYYVAAFGLRHYNEVVSNDQAFQFAIFQMRFRTRWGAPASNRQSGRPPNHRVKPAATSFRRSQLSPAANEAPQPDLDAAAGLPLAFSCGIHSESGSGSFVGNIKFVYAAAGRAVDGAICLSKLARVGSIMASAAATDGSKEYSIGEPRSWEPFGGLASTFGVLYAKNGGRLQAFGTDDVGLQPPKAAQSTAGSPSAASTLQVAMRVEAASNEESPEARRIRRRFLEQQGRLCMEKELAAAVDFDAIFPKGDVPEDLTPNSRIPVSFVAAEEEEDDDDDERLERATTQLEPKSGLFWSLLLGFPQDSERAYWIRQAAGDSSLWRQNYILYFVTCAMILTATFAESTYTTNSLACLLAACGVILVNWFVSTRLALPVAYEFASQTSIGVLLMVGNALSLTTVLNGNLLWLHLELGFAALLMELERLRWPLVALKVWIVGGAALIVGDPRWFRLSGGFTILMSCLAFTWAAWNREVRRRATFANEYTLEALSRRRRRQLIQLRGLLQLLVPTFVIEHVVGKILRENCITIRFEDYVMLDIRTPSSSPSLKSAAAMTEFSSSSSSNAPTTYSSDAVLGALRQRITAIEIALSAAEGRDLVGVIHVLGDTIRIGGPQRSPKATSNNLLASGVALKPRMAAEVDAVVAASLLLRVVSTLLHRTEFSGATMCLVTDSGFGAVLGSHHPTYAVVGPVARTLSSIMAAAPDAFVGMTEKFFRLFTSGVDVPDDELEVVIGEPQTWRLRGPGYVRLRPVSVAGYHRIRAIGEPER